MTDLCFKQKHKTMNSLIFQKVSGITMLITGVGHTSTHFILKNVQNPYPELESDMANSMLNVGSQTLSVLDFHDGFSIAMGLLLIALGLNIFINRNKQSIIINTVVCILMVIIALSHFPLFVIILTFISFLTISIRLVKYEN